MKKVLLILVLLFAGFAAYWYFFKSKSQKKEDVKQGPLVLKTHTDAFNNSIDKLMESYHEVKNAFVDADTAKAKQNTVVFLSRLDSIPVQELKNDTAMIYESAMQTIRDIRSNAQSLLQQSDITEMRKDFSNLTEMLYPAFFKTINYEGPKLYLQHCPMAFDGDKGANWISSDVKIINPYLGKNHPKYKGTMLECGEVKDTIKAL